MRRDGVLLRRCQLEVRGADAQIDALARVGHEARTQPLRNAQPEIARVEHVVPDVAGEDVDLRRAEEARDELVCRMVVQLVRRALLHDVPVLHQHDVVGHGHGLGLVVRDVDGRNAQLELDLLELVAHLIAQLRVEIAQRLIEQEHLRVAHQRAAQRNALALSAGELRRAAVEQLLDGEHFCHVIYPLVNFLPGCLFGFQGEGHVFPHRHVGIQGVFLKYHGNVTLLRRHKGFVLALAGRAGHHILTETDFAADGVQKARDAVHGCGFAAAGGAQKHAELAVLDFQVQLIQHKGFALVIAYAQILD